MQIQSLPLSFVLGLSLACGLLTGCGESIPEKADPQKALAAVTSALEAWKKGDKPAQLSTSTPPIQVSDEDWINGLQLESYVLGAAETHRGLSLQCPVTLSLKATNGKKVTKRVVYTVGTEPVLSVIRQESN